MRFLVDECTGSAVAKWLQGEGYEVLSVFDELRGASDNDLLAKAYAENWIVVTNDRDFGEMVYRENRPHRGVIFLRLSDQRSTSKIKALRRLLSTYADQIVDIFVVVTETQVRFSSS